MSAEHTRIQRDLSRNIRTKVQELLSREVAIAAVVLPPAEQTVIIADLAVATVSCAVSTALQLLHKDAWNLGADAFTEILIAQIRNDKPRMLAELEAALAKRDQAGSSARG